MGRTASLFALIWAAGCGGGAAPQAQTATPRPAAADSAQGAQNAPAAEPAAVPGAQSATADADSQALGSSSTVAATGAPGTPAGGDTPQVAASGGRAPGKAGKSRGGQRTWIGLSDGPAPEASAAPVEQVEAGAIPRTTLTAVLSAGPGRFLQSVQAEPHLVGGRFMGWRLVGLIGAVAGGALQAGDTVMRVNGQSIERPEQFKTVWDSLATQSELVLLVERAGKQSRLRYRIVDDRPPQR
jgi:hypothetical protein